LEFVAIGCRSHPPGTLPKSLAHRATLVGLAALRFTIGEIRATTEMMLRDAPGALQREQVDALLVDQMEAVGSTLAERIGVPFFTICSGLALNDEPDIPPPFTGWQYSPTPIARFRNRLGYAVSDWLLSPIMDAIESQRAAWKMRPLGHASNSFSPLAQFCQQPPAFDFPRKALPKTFHYVGPIRTTAPISVAFPWEKLDGRPLVYASLGTQLNGKLYMFRVIAEACSAFPVQLAITLAGGAHATELLDLPGDPIVVNNAPQMEVLARASLTITHAGLNTVLDSLSYGVPVIAIPIMSEQPAIARRLEWCGAGLSIPVRRLRVDRLSTAIHNTLRGPGYLEAAQRIKESIREAGGASRTADLIGVNLTKPEFRQGQRSVGNHQTKAAGA
jgi:MGT family glycosyltransferase